MADGTDVVHPQISAEIRESQAARGQRETPTVDLSLSAAECRILREAVRIGHERLRDTCATTDAVLDVLSQRLELADQYHAHRVQSIAALHALQRSTPHR